MFFSNCTGSWISSRATLTWVLVAPGGQPSVYRLRAPQEVSPDVALEDVAEPSVSGEPGDLLLNQKVQDLVAALPEKPRIVMVLRYQEDLMPEEIAKVLDMPVRTVKSHLQRSLAMLREKIGRSLGDVR